MHLGGPRIGVLAAQGQAFVCAQLALPRLTVDQKQRVHARDHVDGLRVLRIHFHRIDKLAPRVRPASDMHHLRPPDVVVGLIAVGLQNAFPLAQKLLRTLAPTAQLKLEHRLAAGLSVLPQVGLRSALLLSCICTGTVGLIRL